MTADIPVQKAEFGYGYGVAHLWGRFTKKTVEREFYRHANQCFGIRKSISCFGLRSIEPAEFPTVFCVEPEEISVVLKYNGDTIVWRLGGGNLKGERGNEV